MVSVNPLSPYRPDSVGTVLDGVEVRIVDPDEQGVGEVQVRGPTVMDGYFEAPELTEAAFDGAWLKTGDLGHFDAARHLHLCETLRRCVRARALPALPTRAAASQRSCATSIFSLAGLQAATL